jgi:hypothetical protein
MRTGENVNKLLKKVLDKIEKRCYNNIDGRGKPSPVRDLTATTHRKEKKV